MNFICAPFDALSIHQLYAVMALRQEVFVVEQNCPYLDADGKDLRAHHLMGFDEEGALIAYCRLLPPGLVYHGYASIGRVVNAPHMRGKGMGIELMQEALAQCKFLFGNLPIKISAQCYLIRFYESLGFHTQGESYLEDDIPHIAMIRKTPL